MFHFSSIKFGILLYRETNSDLSKGAFEKYWWMFLQNFKKWLVHANYLPLNMIKLSHYYLTQNYSRYMYRYSWLIIEFFLFLLIRKYLAQHHHWIPSKVSPWLLISPNTSPQTLMKCSTITTRRNYVPVMTVLKYCIIQWLNTYHWEQ